MFQRLFFVLLLAFVTQNSFAQADGIPARLFNGKDLLGFSTWLSDSKHEDPKQTFRVTDGMLHVTGEGRGYIATKKSYTNYRISFEYRWGTKTDGGKYVRNSGLMLHCTGQDGSTSGNRWVTSLEVQLAQGCEGDFIVIRGKDRDGNAIPATITSETAVAADKKTRWKKGGKAVKYSGRQFWWSKHQPFFKELLDTRGKDDIASPYGKWTRVDVMCVNKRVTVRVNGQTVNECFNVFPSSGRIAFQNEGHEVFFRNIRLAEIRPGQATKRPSRPAPDHRDLAYGPHANKGQRLDIYQAKSDKPAPVMVWIHGGGWSAGSKNYVPGYLFTEILPAGVTIVSFEYRFSQVAPHPAQVNDVTRAIQWLRANAKKYNIDPKRVGVMGSSAGGHLSLILATRDESRDPKSDDPVRHQSSRVAFAVGQAGPTDFMLLKDRSLEDGHRHPAYRTLFGHDARADLQSLPSAPLKDASPITFASRDDPPVMICHGTADRIVPVRHAAVLHSALKKAGAPSETMIIEGAGHGLGLSGRKAELSRLVTFIKKHLDVGTSN